MSKQKQPFHSCVRSCVEHKFSDSFFVMIDYHVAHIFYIFLIALSSIVSAGSHPIFAIGRCKNVSLRLKAKDFLFEVKTVSYSLVSYFLVLGVWLWTECVCLCIWNVSLLLLVSVFKHYNLQHTKYLSC